MQADHSTGRRPAGGGRCRSGKQPAPWQLIASHTGVNEPPTTVIPVIRTSVQSNIARGRIAATHPPLSSPCALQWAFNYRILYGHYAADIYTYYY